MTDEDDQIRELIASLQQHCPLIPPVAVEKHGELADRKVEYVLKEGAIALILGEDLSGHSWRQGLNLDSHVWLRLWILILSMENQELGSIYIDAPRRDTGCVRYQQTVEALAKSRMGILEDRDKKIIAANVSPSHYVHKAQQEDVYRMMVKLKAEKEAKGKKRREKDDLEREDEEPKKQKMSSITSVVDSPLSKRMSLCFGFLPSSLDIDPNEAAPRVLTDDDVINKVTFTVAVVHDEQRTRVVGYLIRFLVHDPCWKPGETVDELIKAAEARESNKTNSRFKDPYPNYAAWQKTKFPAHDMTWERWVKAANAAQAKRPSLKEFNSQLGRLARSDETDADLCPLALSPLRRAVKRLKEAGGDVGEMAQYYLNEATATWPDSMEVFQEVPSGVFWDHPTKVGLFGRTFPGALSIKEENPELHKYLEGTFVPLKSVASSFVGKNMRYKTGNVIIHMGLEADRMQRNQDKDTVTSKQMEKFRGICMASMDTLEHLSLSRPTKAMLRWMHQFRKESETVTCLTERYDPEMTLFGNLKARQMVQYEKILTIVQAVITLKIVIVFSVYSGQKGLKGHFLVWGDAGGGKSYLTNNFASKRFIPGTFQLLDRVTGAADQTDLNVLDEIRGYNEVPEHLVSEEAGRRKADEVNAKKSHLTEGGGSVRTYKEMDLPGLGKFSGARVRQQILNYTEICCSNTHPDEGALMSRYHVHLMLQPKIPTNEMKKDEVTHEEERMVTNNFRLNQFFSCWIEKAMTCHAIPCRNPFMQLFEDISARMIQTLKDWDIVDPRNVERPLEIMTHTARELTKERAKMLTYDIKGAPHFGEAFDPYHLKDLAPFLWCDTEITLLTWTLHSSDWIRDSYMNVLQAMCKVVLDRPYDLNKSPYDYYRDDVDGKIKFKTDKNYHHLPEDGKANRFYIDLNFFQIDGENHEAICREISAQTSPYMTMKDVMGTLKQMVRHSFVPRAGESGRNGYARRLLCDDLKNNHRASIAHKVTLTRQNFRHEIDTLIYNVAETIRLDVCRMIADLPEFQYRDWATLNAHPTIPKVIVNNIDWVALYLNPPPEPINLAEMPNYLFHLQHNSRLDRDKQLRVVNAFSDVDAERSADIYSEVPGLSYPLAQFIYFALEKQWIMEKEVLETTYLKTPVIKERTAFPHRASEDDIATLSGSSADHTISIVDLSQRKRICFSPMAIHLYDKEVILDAFIYATLCATTRPGKYLLGWTDQRDDTRLRTLELTPEIIEERCRAFDQDSPDDAVSRFEGIPFKRRGFREKSTHAYIYGIEKSKTVQHKRDKNIEVIADLDRWAAEQQARICGLERPPVVHDYDQYEGTVGNTNYPEEQIQDKIRHSKMNWESNATTKNSRKIARIKK